MYHLTAARDSGRPANFSDIVLIMLSPLLHTAESDSRDQVLDRLTTVFQRLVGLGETRDQLKHFR